VSKFKDALGQEWRIEFDGFLLDRIEKEAKVDLADISAGGLLAVEKDAKALIRVLSVACEDEMKERRKAVSEFVKQIRKEAITRAREAVLDALADFFPENEWFAMRSNLTTRKNQPEMTAEMANAMKALSPEVQILLLREGIEELGNLQSLAKSESVHGPEDTQSMPVVDSQENAELVQDTTP